MKLSVSYIKGVPMPDEIKVAKLFFFYFLFILYMFATELSS